MQALVLRFAELVIAWRMASNESPATSKGSRDNRSGDGLSAAHMAAGAFALAVQLKGDLIWDRNK